MMLKKGLLEENVLKEISHWTRTKGAGFLIYVTNGGKVSYGKPVPDDQKKLKQLQDIDLTLFDEEYWSIWQEYADDNISAYLDSYYQNNETKIDKKSGKLLLTKWRENISTEESELFLRKALNKNSNQEHLSKLQLVMTLYDYLELNALQEYHRDVELVRGELKSLDSNMISLLVASQNFNKVRLTELRETAEEDICDNLIPGNKIYHKFFYQKTRGILNLDNNDLLMDMELEF